MKKTFTTSKHQAKQETLRSFLFSITLLFSIFLTTGSLFAQTRTVTLTTGTSWTPPCGVTSITVQAWGGGGGGAGDGATTASTGGGGGSGAYRTGTLAVTPGTAVAYTLGAGGAGGCGGGGGCAAAGGPGANGTATTIGTISAGGGSGGAANNGAGGAGGTGSGGTGGTNGNPGSAGANNASGKGGDAPNAGGTGGASVTADGNGNVGNRPGGGGSGANQSSGGANTGGAGAAGQIIITYTGAWAGNDIVTAACATSATLAGNTPPSGTGTWTRVSGPNTPTFSDANSATSTVSGLIPGTYILRWTWSGGGCTSISDDVSVIVPEGPGCWTYCSPPTGNLNCTAGDVITRVVFNTIDRSSGCDPGGYINTGLSTAVNIGQAYTLSVTNSTYSGNAAAYIDWNNNGSFEAAEFHSVGPIAAGTKTVSISITVPSDAFGGVSVRMRIRYAYSTSPTLTSSMACTSSGTYGETEDYTLNIGVCTGTCSDGIQNCGETGIDCGGPCVTSCGASCSDAIQNQDETGIDCGGVCPACGAACATVTSSSQTGIPADGIIDLTGGGSATINTCVTFTYSNGGSNWIHGVFMNPAAKGFVSSAATGTPPGALSAQGTTYTWRAISTDFTSSNSGNSIEPDGWYIETSGTPYNPGNNLGYPKGANTSIGPMCFNTVLDCNGLTGDNAGILQFGFTSDSYSGSWTNTACGQEFSQPPHTFSYTLRCPVAPLPVGMLSFKGAYADKKVNLKWITLSELNNDYFVIQKSTDGVHFNDIGKVKGSGTSNTRNSYSFIDNDPVNGTNYYRLKQFDTDGKNALTSIVAVAAIVDLNKILAIYPNPVKNNAEVILSSYRDNDITIYVYDIMGKIVQSFPYTLIKGQNNLNLDLSKLSSGIYSLTAISGNEVIKSKFIKE